MNLRSTESRIRKWVEVGEGVYLDKETRIAMLTSIQCVRIVNEILKRLRRREKSGYRDIKLKTLYKIIDDEIKGIDK